MRNQILNLILILCFVICGPVVYAQEIVQTKAPIFKIEKNTDQRLQKSDEVILQTTEAGEYRIDIINPMGIKAGELLASKRLSDNDKVTFSLEKQTFRTTGTWYLLLYRDNQMIKSTAYPIKLALSNQR